MGATFKKVNGTKVTLADIKPNDNFGQDGGQAIIMLDVMGGKKEAYVYLGEEMAQMVSEYDPAFASTTAGWYTEDAWTDFQNWASGEGEIRPLVNQNGVELEQGEAIMFSPDAYGGFVSSGEVATEDVEVVGDGSGKVFRCNCTPVTITLGQLLPNDNFGQDGGQAILLLDGMGGKKEAYVYLGEEMAQMVSEYDPAFASTTVGWYTEDAWTDFQNWASGEGEIRPLVNQNSVELAPGHGFMFSPDKDGGFFIPSAID